MKKTTLTYLDKVQFQEDLLTWYRAEKRDLPWRSDQDPYKIWVSEIMLQQTKVDTVIPYFNRFIEKFPTVADLASAQEQEVLKEWEGLGYYSRARNLHMATREVVEVYRGIIPDDKRELTKLKGVGPYTLGAILSIAFNKPEPAVDGNVMRVCSRLFSIWEDIAKASTRKIFEGIIENIIAIDHPSDFNQAVMELGAIICTPKSPSCMLCPVQTHCQAFHEGTQAELPIKSKSKKPTEIQLITAVVKNEKGQLLVQKRPEKGMLANLWEFPMREITEGFLSEQEQLHFFLKEKYNINVSISKKLPAVRHVFSHVIWNITVYEAFTDEEITESQTIKLVQAPDIENMPFSVSQQKILKSIGYVNE